MFTSPQMILRLHWWVCNNVLTTYKDPATKKWDTRMSNLTMKWDSSRKLLLEAVRSCEGLPSPNICPHCCEGQVLIRCSDCPKTFYCPSCDGKVHSSLPFHGREGFCKWFLWGYPSNNYHWWKWIKERNKICWCKLSQHWGIFLGRQILKLGFFGV